MFTNDTDESDSETSEDTAYNFNNEFLKHHSDHLRVWLTAERVLFESED